MKDQVQAETLELRTDSELVEYSSERSVLLSFRTFYYPGWRAYLLNPESGDIIEELPIALRGKLGLMTVRVPAGKGQVLLRFEDTPLRELSTVVTFTSLALLLILIGTSVALRASKARGR